MQNPPWQPLAQRQAGVVARRQLTGLGYTHEFVRRQLDARRWVMRTPRVVSTTTGPPTWEQRVWTGVLHAGDGALVGGLTALACRGLRNWHREEITVLVDDELSFEAVAGVRFFRTRRPFAALRDRFSELPICRLEPAALLFAAYDAGPANGSGSPVGRRSTDASRQAAHSSPRSK